MSQFKVSSFVGLLAWINLLSLPWVVLATDLRIGDKRVVFAIAVWFLVGA